MTTFPHLRLAEILQLRQTVQNECSGVLILQNTVMLGNDYSPVLLSYSNVSCGNS